MRLVTPGLTRHLHPHAAQQAAPAQLPAMLPRHAPMLRSSSHLVLPRLANVPCARAMVRVLVRVGLRTLLGCAFSMDPRGSDHLYRTVDARAKDSHL